MRRSQSKTLWSGSSATGVGPLAAGDEPVRPGAGVGPRPPDDDSRDRSRRRPDRGRGGRGRRRPAPDDRSQPLGRAQPPDAFRAAAGTVGPRRRSWSAPRTSKRRATSRCRTAGRQLRADPARISTRTRSSSNELLGEFTLRLVLRRSIPPSRRRWQPGESATDLTAIRGSSTATATVSPRATWAPSRPPRGPDMTPPETR